ncbi:MAG: glycosyltransferase family 4 protein [Bacteroidales bacterium]|nr:glycosyltransferase family 4 protein [Bacteroidales bacterium]
MKIVYCTDSICYHGGIAVVTITKANALARIPGNEIWIAVSDNRRPSPVLPLSPEVRLVDFGVDYYEDDWRSRFHALKGIFLKRRIHKNKLKEFLCSVAPDIVISTGTSEKHFLPFIKVTSKPAFIREIHFTSDYRKLSAGSVIDRLLARIADFVDYRLLISRYDKIVLLSEEDRHANWSAEMSNISVIPDPLCYVPERVSTLDNKVVIAVGRLVRQKNFSSLVRAWRKVSDRCPGWELQIWGEGGERSMLESLISSMGLSGSVKLMGYSDNIMARYPDASIFVLSSLFEGFGMVIVEAMSCGLPVVSYACPCGPKDIIKDGFDGFLVPQGDEDALADKICELIEDENKRGRMGKAALADSLRFDINPVIRLWMDLFGKTIPRAKGRRS